MKQRLIVVSNRVAVPRSKRPAPGGLAVGVLSALQESGGVWFGWNGKIAEDTTPELSDTSTDFVSYITTSLTKKEYDYYYKGYANRVLWPLCHTRMNLVEYQREYFDSYMAVNRRFAQHLLRIQQPEDIFWIHDYHCIPLARELRELDMQQKIGFFLHIPFPSYDVFRALPKDKKLLEYMGSYDLIGFQTQLDLEAFIDCIRHTFKDTVIKDNTVTFNGRTIHADVFPIGIDYDNIQTQAKAGRNSTLTVRMTKNLVDRSLIIGVDRLDYSKGLAERFLAYQKFMKNYPNERNNTVLLQIAQPSRSDVPEYEEIQEQLEHLVGRINGQFSEFDHVPLRYLNRSFSRTAIMGFLSMSRVGLITPLRDGMNLVAKEYVACQDGENPGVLILSRMTGAAVELGGALLVTPYDVDGVAETIATALVMSIEERRERWQSMMSRIESNHITDWSNNFLSALISL